MKLDNDSSDDEFFGKQEEEAEGRVTVFPVNESTSSRTILEGQDNIINHESLSCREWKAQETNFRNLAFLEEFERSKELQLQRGFEEGYLSTLNEAIQIGMELGKLSITAAMAKIQPADNNNISLAVHKEEVIQMVEAARKHLLMSGEERNTMDLSSLTIQTTKS